MYTYSPTEVSCLIAGTQVEGWDRITITPDAPIYRTVKGIRGKHARVRVDDKAFLVEIELDQTSDSNMLMYAILQEDLANDTGRLQILIKDGLGIDLFTSDMAYLEGVPIVSFSGTSETRVWRLRCLSAKVGEYNTGSPFSNIFDGITSLFN